MAKGLRSNVKQKNKSKLRATVFGPVIDSRTERLSAKLQELAAKPKEADMEDADKADADKEDEGDAGKGGYRNHPRLLPTYRNKENNTVYLNKSSNIGFKTEMDIDQPSGAAKASSGSANRIQKRARRKTRPSITFAAHPQKAKRLGKKK
ncbi:hypothetical protein AJ79_03072 [Helicocarpus griseus UAMH5409]|uniref:DUF2423 domain-containing protein n=1 Tax=Helicocarpus griseus UAMH5409 TaxID=1447875 RepID=A0A2B7XZT4_9EURO|nr:hypothetical protein AJ79_03072 [Helicocarpus griseus UAMH5409]